MKKHWLISALKSSRDPLALLGSAFVAGAFALPVTAGPATKALPHAQTHSSTEKKMLQPTSDAAEALTRLLALVDSLHEPRDLSPEQLGRFTGLEINSNPQKPGSANAGYPLTKEWDSIYLLYPDLTSKLPSLLFMFQPTPEFRGQSLDSTDICALDMDQFHAVLLHMGFKHTGNNRAGTLARQYRRGNVDMNVAHVGESREKIQHDCVRRVDAYFVDRTFDQGTAK